MSPRAARLSLAACLVLGAVLRAIPCANDFWLDEIWTWSQAMRLDSPLEVLTRIHHSNNHPLNTLLVYWIGDRREWALYRLPSLAAGIATLLLGARLGARRGRLEAVLCTALLAASFPLVHFSSEARGYSLAVCFAFASLLALLGFLERGRRRDAAGFGACTILGLLAQPMSVFAWAGALALSARALARRPRAAALRAALALHAAPALALALFWWLDLRHLRIGGGPETRAAAVVARSIGYPLGLPVLPELAPLHAAIALAIVAAGLRQLRRAGDELWIYFAVAIALAPAVVLGALRPDLLDVRYFLIGIAFGLVLLGWVLAEALRAPGWRRAAAVFALAVFAVGNAVRAERFLALGRGGYQAALRTMAEQSAGAEIVVGGDHDFRDELTLRFYARLLPPGRSLDYRRRDAWPRGGPEWYVVHAGARPAVVAPELRVGGQRYQLVAEFDHAAISGFWWGVYRRSASPPSPRRRRIRAPKPSGPKGSGPMRATRS